MSQHSPAQGSATADGWKFQAGLRFYLAFIVVCGHLFRFSPDVGIGNRLLRKIGSLDAVTAVFCFLIISGFSIAHSLHRNPKGFYRRRLLRIYPLYVCGVLLALVPFCIAGPAISTHDGHFELAHASTVFGNLFFLQGFIADPLPSNRPLWTLAVEVFCYLLAPLFCRMKSWLLLGVVAASSAAFAVYPYLHLKFYSSLSYGLPALFLIWAWLSGFLLHRHRDDPRFRIFVLCIGVLLLSLNTTYNAKLAIFTYVFATAVVVFAGELRAPQRLLGVMNYLGELSYPLYVLHTPILILCAGVLGITFAPALVGMALLGAIGFYHVVDRPVRLRAKSGAGGLSGPERDVE